MTSPSSPILLQPSSMPKRRSKHTKVFLLLYLASAWTTCAFTGTAFFGTSISARRLTTGRRQQAKTSRVLAQPFHKHEDQLETESQFASSNENELITTSADNFQSGFLVLLTVPLAWGTFEPAVRYVYEVAPQVPTLVFSVAYYAVAAVGLLALFLYETVSGGGGKDSDDDTTTMAHLSRKSLWGGIELGTYLFLGNAFQVFGLRTTPSDRAAFLL